MRSVYAAGLLLCMLGLGGLAQEPSPQSTAAAAIEKAQEAKGWAADAVGDADAIRAIEKPYRDDSKKRYDDNLPKMSYWAKQQLKPDYDMMEGHWANSNFHMSLGLEDALAGEHKLQQAVNEYNLGQYTEAYNTANQSKQKFHMACVWFEESGTSAHNSGHYAIQLATKLTFWGY